MDNSPVPPAPFRTRRDGKTDLRFGPHPGQRRRVTRKRLAQLRNARKARKPIGTHWIPNPRPETVRMRQYRDKQRAQRRATQERAKIARKEALAVARAAAGLPPARTQAEVQAAYRRRRKLKGLDPYSKRELAEQAMKKVAEAALYENRVHGEIINQWFAPQIDLQTAIAFVAEKIIPSQPQAAEHYIQQIDEKCRKYALNRNRYTLTPDHMEYARQLRALVFMQRGGKDLAISWNIAQVLGADILPADPREREELLDATQSILGAGDAIVRDMRLELNNPGEN